MSPSPPDIPDVPDTRAALAALTELEGAASYLRLVLTCAPHASPDVLARLAGLLQATARFLKGSLSLSSPHCQPQFLAKEADLRQSPRAQPAVTALGDLSRRCGVHRRLAHQLLQQCFGVL